MKRLALSLAVVAMASLACQRADQGEQGDTQAEPSVQSDTTMTDSMAMPRDTAKQM